MMETWNVAKFETEKRRFAILRYLYDTPGYEANRHLLVMAAKAQGIPTTNDQLDHALGWLQEMEFVTVKDFGEVRLARLTSDGQEVALGERVVPGVSRPGPGA